jgi:hypothetical protein
VASTVARVTNGLLGLAIPPARAPAALTWGDFSRVHYHAGLDVATVHEVRDRTLVLYDVIGAAIPPSRRWLARSAPRRIAW